MFPSETDSSSFLEILNCTIGGVAAIGSDGYWLRYILNIRIAC